MSSTVIALPFSAHLRDDHEINNRLALRQVDKQANTMFQAISWGLIAASGRFPITATPAQQEVVANLRDALGMRRIGNTEAHWIYQYLTGEMPSSLIVVRRTDVVAYLQQAQWTITQADDPKIIAATSPKGDEQITLKCVKFQVASATPTVAPATTKAAKTADTDTWCFAKDYRSRTKGTIFTQTAEMFGTVTVQGELGAGSSSPYYLGQWICGAEPPAKLLEQAPDKAADLDLAISKGFATARAEVTIWREVVERRLKEAGEKSEDKQILSATRECVVACAYEALKVVTSWASLDVLAAEDKARREQQLSAALAVRVPAERRPAVFELIDAIERRQRDLTSDDTTAIALGLDGLDWRACEALSRWIAGQELAYRRDQQLHPWSHPDVVGFQEAFGRQETRQALADLVAVQPVVGDLSTLGEGGEEAAPLESLAEKARYARRARGRARLTIPEHCRIHVDRQSSGATGTLESTVDPLDAPRRRGAHAETPTAVLVASLTWLGLRIPLRFHVARRRTITLANQASSWDVTFKRSLNRAETLRGELKSFDLSIDDGFVTITLPINTELPGFDDVPTTQTFAVGGAYRPRPGAEPIQPKAGKVLPPEAGTVIGIDIGLIPLAGWAVIAKSGNTYDELAHGVIGATSFPATAEVLAPRLTIGFLRERLQVATDIRLQLRTIARNVAKPEQERRPGPKEIQRCGRLARIDDGRLFQAIELLGRRTDPWVAAIIPMVDHVLLAIPEAVSGAISSGHRTMVQKDHVTGRGQAWTGWEVASERLIDRVIAQLPDDGDLRRISRLLIAPVAVQLLAYQAQRVAGHDIAQVTRRSAGSAAEMDRQRDLVAQRHGYQSEAHFRSIQDFGTQSRDRLYSYDQERESTALSVRLALADQWEALSSHAKGVAGWSARPLGRGETTQPRDPRHQWEECYGFLMTLAQRGREFAHKVLAHRAVAQAVAYDVDALVIEDLNLPFSTRRTSDSNGLSRRLAVQDWMSWILRAADLAGVPVVLGNSAFTTREIAPLRPEAPLAPRELGLAINGRILHQDGSPLAVAPRVNAARNLALRSLAGHPERARFAVRTGTARDGATYAVFAPPVQGRNYAAWQERQASALGAGSAAALAWKLDADGAFVVARTPAGFSADQADWLAAAGALRGKPRWFTSTQYLSLEKRVLKARAQAG